LYTIANIQTENDTSTLWGKGQEERKGKERKEIRNSGGSERVVSLIIITITSDIFVLNKLLDCEIEWKGIMKEPKSK
jgi:hypothetical protein